MDIRRWILPCAVGVLAASWLASPLAAKATCGSAPANQVAFRVVDGAGDTAAPIEATWLDFTVQATELQARPLRLPATSSGDLVLTEVAR